MYHRTFHSLTVATMLAIIAGAFDAAVAQDATTVKAGADSAGKSGAWVFKEVKTTKKIEKESPGSLNHQLQTNTGVGTQHTAASHRDYWCGYGDKSKHRGTIKTTHAWTVPPTHIAGGSEIALELEAAASISQTPDTDSSFSCRTHFYIGNSPEIGNASANVHSSFKQKTTHDKKTIKAKIGKGSKPGDELVLDITLQTPVGSAYVDYKYQWDPTASPPTPPEKPPGPPAPPEKPPDTPPTDPDDVKQMTIQAGSRTVKVGDTVIVPIWLIRGQGIANLNLNVTYKPAVAKTTGAFAKGNLLSKSMFETNTGESGVVRIGFAQNKDLAGPVTGTLAQITFTATGQPGDSTPLHVELTTVSSAAGGKPTVATIDGEIRIVGPGGVIKGDSDRDGKLTARDAQNALKMSVKLIPVDMVCDMDEDGRVTSTDARLILQKVVGK